jgi:predicted HTH domain antitoxin
MKRLRIELPDEIAEDLKAQEKEVVGEVVREGLKAVRVRTALTLYSAGQVSFGRAAELAHLRQDELARLARALGIEPPYREEAVREEVG